MATPGTVVGHYPAWSLTGTRCRGQLIAVSRGEPPGAGGASCVPASDQCDNSFATASATPDQTTPPGPCSFACSGLFASCRPAGPCRCAAERRKLCCATWPCATPPGSPAPTY